MWSLKDIYHENDLFDHMPLVRLISIFTEQLSSPVVVVVTVLIVKLGAVVVVMIIPVVVI